MNKLRTLILTLALTVTGNTHAEVLPMPALPSTWDSRIVADQLYINGSENRVISFVTEQKPPRVILHFRKLWGSRVRLQQHGESLELRGFDGKYLYIVELNEETLPGQTTGLITVIEPESDKRPDWFADDIVIPSQTTVLADIQANDQGKISRTVHLSNIHSRMQNQDTILSALRTRGWQQTGLQSEDLNNRGFLLHNRGQKLFAGFTEADDKTEILLIFSREQRL